MPKDSRNVPRNVKISIYAGAGILAAAVLLSGGYPSIDRSPPARSAGALDKVTIAVNMGFPGSCSIFAAMENGYFLGEGVLVDILPRSTGKGSLDATLRGEADLATAADVPIMFAIMDGDPISVVATLFKSDRTYGIASRKDRGITAPASLNGKRIGVTARSAGQFVLAASLNRHRLAASDVTMVNLAPEELPAALARGDVDAVVTWQPFLGASLAGLGDNAFFLSAEDVYDGEFNLAATRTYVMSHPRTVEKVLRAMVRGARFCKDSPQPSQAIVVKAIKVDAKLLKELWPSYRFDVSLDQSLLLALEDETRWAINGKLTPRTDAPNYLDHIYFDALVAVSPAAVTIIH
jgi:NitT/TauT family transport system substrate-binding protein